MSLLNVTPALLLSFFFLSLLVDLPFPPLPAKSCPSVGREGYEQTPFCPGSLLLLLLRSFSRDLP